MLRRRRRPVEREILLGEVWKRGKSFRGSAALPLRDHGHRRGEGAVPLDGGSTATMHRKR
eukprot:1532252-Pyramimonas_sp.AAC.1